MNIQDFVIEKAQMLSNGYEKGQIKTEIWRWVLMHYNGTMRLEAMIELSMEIYAEVMVRYGTGL